MSTPHGEMKWQAVCLATQHMDNPRRARADAARAYVRNTFAFLPSLIVTAVQMFEWNTEQHIEYVDGHLVAHIESVFDGYLDDDGKRHQVVPALTYATPEEAGRAIVEHLGNLLTGEDVVTSVVFA